MNDTLVIDIETKKSFAEVGGERNVRALGVAVAGVYSYGENRFAAFEEHELPAFGEMLKKTGHLIGFHIKGFDLPVLEPYFPAVRFADYAVTDIFEDAVKFLGHRIGLDAVARSTLGQGKSGHGLEALEWFREGRVEEVKKYCLDDVRLTRDVYEYGKKHHHVLFESRMDGKTHSIPISWGIGTARSVVEVIEEACADRRRLAIEYVSSEDNDGLGFRKERRIDVYRVKENGDVGAYCHLRGGVRVFRMGRIMRAEPTGETYAMPHDLQPSLF